MNSKKESNTQSTDKRGRDERGRFVKGNRVGEDTLFEKENAAACKYKPEYADKMIEYFNQPNVTVEYAEKYDKNGNLVSKTPITLVNDYPTFESFAASLGVTTRTLLNWCEISRRFSAFYARAKEIQKGKLIANTLAGRYDTSFAKFEAVNNHGMAEKSMQDASVVFSIRMPDEIDKESN